MYKRYWPSWFLLCLFLLIINMRMLPNSHVQAAQVALQEKQIPSTVNLLLQDEEKQQTVLMQNIQMITALLLDTEDEAQQKVFLPLITH